MGQVPQPNAQQMGISPELQRMLQGEGFSPAILAQMKAGVTDSTARAGAQNLSQTKRALGEAGMAGSPAAAAVTGDVSRQVGQAQTEGNRQIDIQNAQEGLTNFRTGVGAQTTIGLSNLEQANQMALANANRLFAAMQQNTANQQGANIFNTGNENQQKMTQAGQTSSFLGQQGNTWGNQSLNKAANAETQNVSNQMTWQQNEAERERQRQIVNQGQNENRWQTAAQGFNPLAA